MNLVEALKISPKVRLESQGRGCSDIMVLDFSNTKNKISLEYKYLISTDWQPVSVYSNPVPAQDCVVNLVKGCRRTGLPVVTGYRAINWDEV